MPKKIRWYYWLNPLFYAEMIVLAQLQRALNSLCYNVTEKLKDVLSADDFNQIQDSIETMVSESVSEKVEAETTRIELLAEEYVEKQISEGIEAKTAELVDEYDRQESS